MDRVLKLLSYFLLLHPYPFLLRSPFYLPRAEPIRSQQRSVISIHRFGIPVCCPLSSFFFCNVSPCSVYSMGLALFHGHTFTSFERIIMLNHQPHWKRKEWKKSLFQTEFSTSHSVHDSTKKDLENQKKGSLCLFGIRDFGSIQFRAYMKCFIDCPA